MAPSSKVILVTGGSSGLGNALCWRMAGQGHRVVGTSRKPAFVPTSWDLIAMEVMDDTSVQATVDHVIAKHGRIDVLVNNAGVGMQGPLEECDVDMAMHLFETDVLGVHRMCRAVLPHMRGQGIGLVINVGSIVGNYGMPYRGFYSAAKAALQRYSEVLRMEEQRFGIRVTTVEPGGFRSNIGRSRLRPTHISDAYQDRYSRSMKTLQRVEARCRDAEEFAMVMVGIVDGPAPAAIYRPAQPMALLSIVLKWSLPGRLFERVLGRYFA